MLRKLACAINANAVRGRSYENFFTQKFIIRKFLYTKISRSTVHVWGGTSAQGATQVVIFTGIVNATHYILTFSKPR